jgi:hypothetical protein
VRVLVLVLHPNPSGGLRCLKVLVCGHPYQCGSSVSAFLQLVNEASPLTPSVLHTTSLPPCPSPCRLQALAEKEGDGMAKMLYRKDTGEILGVHIIGLHAADLIHEASNAIATKQTVQVSVVVLGAVSVVGGCSGREAIEHRPGRSWAPAYIVGAARHVTSMALEALRAAQLPSRPPSAAAASGGWCPDLLSPVFCTALYCTVSAPSLTHSLTDSLAHSLPHSLPPTGHQVQCPRAPHPV